MYQALLYLFVMCYSLGMFVHWEEYQLKHVVIGQQR